MEFETATARTIVTVLPALHTVQDNIGKILCSRHQVPLILAYALTIHRAQGQTLDAVIFDMREIFACGQVYTALGRARSFESVKIRGGIPQDCRLCDPKVLVFEENARWTDLDNKSDIVQ